MLLSDVGRFQSFSFLRLPEYVFYQHATMVYLVLCIVRSCVFIWSQWYLGTVAKIMVSLEESVPVAFSIKSVPQCKCTRAPSVQECPLRQKERRRLNAKRKVGSVLAATAGGVSAGWGVQWDSSQGIQLEVLPAFKYDGSLHAAANGDDVAGPGEA